MASNRQILLSQVYELEDSIESILIDNEMFEELALIIDELFLSGYIKETLLKLIDLLKSTPKVPE